MVNVVGIVIVTFFTIVIGGGLAYLIYLKTRPKKMVWSARVYQLSDSTREVKLDKEGQIISKMTLNDLKPYALDILEKIEKDPGITIYRLKKLNVPTGAVEGDVVDYWGMQNGKELKEVNVVLHKNSATIIKKGYDKNTGEIIFNPVPHNRINILKSEIALKKDRIKKEKDILEAITPWIVAGICMMGLIAIGYILIDGFIEVSKTVDNSIETLHSIEKMRYESDGIYAQLRQGTVPTENPIGQQSNNAKGLPQGTDTIKDG